MHISQAVLAIVGMILVLGGITMAIPYPSSERKVATSLLPLLCRSGGVVLVIMGMIAILSAFSPKHKTPHFAGFSFFNKTGISIRGAKPESQHDG